MNQKHTLVPASMAELRQQLEQIRSSQPRRSRLPESLWIAAVELARQQGLYRVAHTLRLDYMGLKKRLNGVTSRRSSATRTAFLELVTPSAMPECIIELEWASGSKMRIQWKAAAPPDWASLLRAWREVAG